MLIENWNSATLIRQSSSWSFVKPPKFPFAGREREIVPKVAWHIVNFILHVTRKTLETPTERRLESCPMRTAAVCATLHRFFLTMFKVTSFQWLVSSAFGLRSYNLRVSSCNEWKRNNLKETFPNIMSRNTKTSITTKLQVLTWTLWSLNPTAALSIGKRNWIRIRSHTLLLRLTPHAKRSRCAVFAWAEVMASIILTISS